MDDARDPSRWVVDRNGDGFADDVVKRIVVDPPGNLADRAFWARLIDLAAWIGVETHALPFPLVIPATDVEDDPGERIRNVDDLPVMRPAETVADDALSEAASHETCLTRLFTLEGALVDRDSDLLPDASRIAFSVPAEMPASLGCALANVAARLGMESGGLTFPLVREPLGDDLRFEVRITDVPAMLTATGDGWVAAGEARSLAALLERVAANWPHITAPETGGAGAAISRLRRWLAGDGPEPDEAGESVWEQEWSDVWEIERLLELAERHLPDALGSLTERSSLCLTAFVSEPPDQRAAVREQLMTLVASQGIVGVEVVVLSAFKSGLSWLLDDVAPALDGRDVGRIRIEYAPFEQPEESTALDLRIRWLQELFPGTELLAAALSIPLESIDVVEGEPGVTFRAEAWDRAGEGLGVWKCDPIQRSRPFVDAISDSGQVLVTTGGWVLSVDGTPVNTMACPTDLETFWLFWQTTVIPEIFGRIAAQGGAHAAAQPFFSELLVEVWISEPNEVLGLREENVSAAEALAEDLYFTTLDAIELHGKATTGERLNAPGAVIPIVHVTPGEAPRAKVTLRAALIRRDLARPELRVVSLSLQDEEFVVGVEVETDDDAATLGRLRELVALEQPAGASLLTLVTIGSDSILLRLPVSSLLVPTGPEPTVPPMDANIWGDGVMEQARSLTAFPEVTAWVEEESYQGRPIVALALAAPTPGRLSSATKLAILKPTHLIIARHHANEISSTNAAFRLAWNCATDPDWRRYLDRVNIIILPEENPDGAALHVRLASEPEARNWKHHAARYNALGCEYGEAHFDADTRFGEARARTSLWRRWPADVVVDNHGVPSHEWVQPFAGYGSPPRFAVSYWVVQALLYGIARWIDDADYSEHRQAVEALRKAVSTAVRDTDIGAWNQVYWESYQFWGQSRLPERFPGDFRDGMLWHIDSAALDPNGRSFTSRYPKTTVLSWVTEVNDETASGEHLERVARAHLLANQATLELLHAAAPPTRRWTNDHGDGRWTERVGRDRPLVL